MADPRQNRQAPPVADDSVTRSEPGAPEEVGKSGRPRGEDDRKKGAEPGRKEKPPKGPSERPQGDSTGRDSTSIDPQDPIDPESPNLR
jgi:hypothetical protein